MEIHPLGPCVIIDTAGFGDDTALGKARLEKTQLAMEKSDVAIYVISIDECVEMGETLAARVDAFRTQADRPTLVCINKMELAPELAEKTVATLSSTFENVKPAVEVLATSTVTGEGIDSIREALTMLVPADFQNAYITQDLVEAGDLVLLVMPQDIQAPKGRLILPQVQTIRELLDRKCLVTSVTTDQFEAMLTVLSKPPKLIITDSQVFDYVYSHKPAESMLTSFSVLFAAQKGDLSYYVEGARAIDSLTADSHVLIAECCSHAPLTEDIGRVKIPNMLRKRFGETLQVDLVSGTDFPQDLTGYDLVIQCGACMFNRRYVMSRIDRAKSQSVPMTNYGIVIAHLTGILDKITL